MFLFSQPPPFSTSLISISSASHCSKWMTGVSSPRLLPLFFPVIESTEFGRSLPRRVASATASRISAATCSAWDMASHQQITRTALDSLPKPLAACFGAETEPLVRIYCMYPDRYLEMEQYDFVRSSPGPRTAEEIRSYCVRPDG